MFVNRDGAMGEGARLLAQDSLRWHIDIFFAYQFFLGFSKEGFRVIVPDLVNSLSPLSAPRIGSLISLKKNSPTDVVTVVGKRSSSFGVRSTKREGLMFLYC